MPENHTIYRGALLESTQNPWTTKSDQDACRFFPDGGLVVAKGTIQSCDHFVTVSKQFPSAKVVDHRGYLIVPGFIDCHLHYPQTKILGSYGSQLLEWLATYVFPEEYKLNSKDYADELAERFFQILLAQGTTTCQSFATTHPNSVHAFVQAAERKQLRTICGLTGIDREGTAPDYYRDTPESFHEQSSQLIEQYHNKGRFGYAITPRFALGSTELQLEKAQALKHTYSDCWVNTHLSETQQEIDTVLGFYPKAKDYLEVYERFDLVGPKFSAGHGIHLSDSEFQRLSQAGGAIGFCPSSNLFLGSGLFDLRRATDPKNPIRFGLACDTGAGNQFGLLQTLDNAYKVGMLQAVEQDGTSRFESYKISAAKGLYLATLGAAHSLYLDNYIGNFTPGKEADFIVLDPWSTATLSVRNEGIKPTDLETALHLFFGLMLCGDERAIRQTYILGSASL